MITALSQNNVAKILTFDNERLEALSSFQQYNPLCFCNPVAVSLDVCFGPLLININQCIPVTAHKAFLRNSDPAITTDCCHSVRVSRFQHINFNNRLFTCNLKYLISLTTATVTR